MRISNRRIRRPRAQAAFALPLLLAMGFLLFSTSRIAGADAGRALGPLPDPSARLLRGDGASEYWTLYIELESGHRISQRFLLTNAGPGEHTAVAVGHLMEPGRAPYRYENGRRRSRWTLSEDRLFFDIAASHLDLHRPTGRLLITKDDIEIRLEFDFSKSGLAVTVPRDRLPAGYAVDILTVAARTAGTIHAPWMQSPIKTSGRMWMAHTWTERSEASLVDRRLDLYAEDGKRALYGLQLQGKHTHPNFFLFGRDSDDRIIESPINEKKDWHESLRAENAQGAQAYPLPGNFSLSGAKTGQITLGREWLRFDPLSVIPNPFRWFIRRVTEPQEVWADARISGTIWSASGSPSLPQPDESSSPSRSASRAEQESEKGTAVGSVTGVASITFMNPTDRR